MKGAATSNTKGKRIFLYRISPETLGFALVLSLLHPVVHNNDNTVSFNGHIAFAYSHVVYFPYVRDEQLRLTHIYTLLK